MISLRCPPSVPSPLRREGEVEGESLTDDRSFRPLVSLSLFLGAVLLLAERMNPWYAFGRRGTLEFIRGGHAHSTLRRYQIV